MIYEIFDYKGEVIDSLEVEFPIMRWNMSPPTVKTNYVEIPYSNGMIDLTEVLDGNVYYGNRQVDFEFLITGEYEENRNFCEYVMKRLHGKRARFSTENGDEYTGRFYVDFSPKKSKFWQLTIRGDIDV